MNIQIFGTAKSFDTKKAQRWFKERGIRFQMIDLAVKGMSRGEFESVCRAVGGWEALFDPDTKDNPLWQWESLIRQRHTITTKMNSFLIYRFLMVSRYLLMAT